MPLVISRTFGRTTISYYVHWLSCPLVAMSIGYHALWLSGPPAIKPISYHDYQPSCPTAFMPINNHAHQPSNLTIPSFEPLHQQSLRQFIMYKAVQGAWTDTPMAMLTPPKESMKVLMRTSTELLSEHIIF